MRWVMLLGLLGACDVVFRLDMLPTPGVRSLEIDSLSAQPLADFPVSILLTDPELAMSARADGADILFTDDAGRELPYEIVSYQGGALEAWVRVSLDGPMTIQLHSGGPVHVHDSTRTWSSLYAGVWHLGDAVDRAADSTANHDDLHAAGDPATMAAGAIGGARMYTETASTPQLCGEPLAIDGAQSASFAAWMSTSGVDAAFGAYDVPLDSGGTAPVVPGFAFEYSGTLLKAEIADGTVTDIAEYTAPEQLGHWSSRVGVIDRDSGQLEAFQDGELAAMTPLTSGDVTPAKPFCIPGSFGYSGAIDEVRVYTAAVSAEWIRAEYDNVFQRDRFVKLIP